MNKIRITHLISPTKIYGKERWLLAFLKYLDRERYSAIVMPLAGSLDFPLGRRLQEEKIEFHPVFVKGGFKIGDISRIASLLRSTGTDILHTHDYKSDILGLLANKRVDARIVCTPHGWSNAPDMKLRLYQLADKMLLRYFDRVLPLSEHMAGSLKGVARKKITMIRNFLDVSTIPGRSDYDTSLITYIGRLTWLKRVEDAIAALTLTHNENARLQVIGDGPSRSKLEGLAERLNLRERVSFLGFREDALDLLNRSCALVIPSLTEGISRITMEAMALGKPVIGADIPGISALIENGNTGILVPTRSPAAIASAVDALTGDKSLTERLGKSAKRFIEENHSAEYAVAEYERVYCELMGAG